VVVRVASRSLTAAVTIMVPNSLGPAELLLAYGTPAQKARYLPRLAAGDEIPCFALTEPGAGSDAASARSRGVVCRGTWQGRPVLGLRLTFAKRYITLAPVATLIGLAFRLYDPDHLLSGVEDRGITCALLPRDLPGLSIGRRHDPMGVPFQNGPIAGEDVFVPIDTIIGGPAQAGNGWRMLMETLAAGRGISLPSLAVGAAGLATAATAAHATVREQFGLPIGRFEGVRERLARIAGLTYLMEATRRLTVGAVDAKERPAIASAIAKAYLTESMRTAVNDAMDLLAGAAIIRGPANVMARAYIGLPIGITVEGANILTRSLIVFGQGALRCHPYLKTEMEAAAAGDIAAFDRALFGHLGHVAGSIGRLLLAGRPRTLPAEAVGEARHYRALARLSALFAVTADVTLALLGGALKRREYLSGRLSDALAWLYLGSASLKRFHDDGRPSWQRPALDWAMAHALHHAETALAGVVANLPRRGAARPVAGLLRLIAFPLGGRHPAPDDRRIEALADTLLAPDGTLQAALCRDVYRPPADAPGLGRLLAAADAVAATAAIRARLGKGPVAERAAAALSDGTITADDYHRLLAAEARRDAAIQVDAFPPEADSGGDTRPGAGETGLHRRVS
jgi:acyl-CoA dehydrogenase